MSTAPGQVLVNRETSLSYDQRASANRPHDEQSLARECSRLLSTGLRVRDIATALRLDISDVLKLLREGASPCVSAMQAGHDDLFDANGAWLRWCGGR